VAPLKDLWQWSKPLLRKSMVESNDAPGVNRPGLICLKGGDLAQEIQESNTRPHLIEIKDIFDETYFRDKYIVYVPR
jgi:16S rRNA (guanine527-N7)-methyltransferase